MAHTEEAMVELFNRLDNGDGQVSVQELKSGIKTEFCADISDEKVVAMFQGLDMDGDNLISKEEFIAQMCGKIDRRLAFTNKFKELDTDNSNSLSLEELRPILLAIYEDEAAIEGMFKTCDCDSDGKITCEEFIKSMQ